MEGDLGEDADYDDIVDRVFVLGRTQTGEADSDYGYEAMTSVSWSSTGIELPGLTQVVQQISTEALRGG